MSKIFGVEVKTVDWVKGNDVVMYMNGVDAIVTHDLTGKKATKTIKEPQMVVHHAGESMSLKELRANAKPRRARASPTPPKK